MCLDRSKGGRRSAQLVLGRRVLASASWTMSAQAFRHAAQARSAEALREEHDLAGGYSLPFSSCMRSHCI